MKINFLVIVLSLGLFGNACTSKKNAGAENGAAKEIKWVYNLYEALISAEESNKPLMVDFYADWCGWCKKLDKDTYTDPEVIRLSAQFICVKVDADKDSASSGKYKVKGLPTIIFMDSAGRIINEISGYRDSRFFIKAMSEISADNG